MIYLFWYWGQSPLSKTEKGPNIFLPGMSLKNVLEDRVEDRVHVMNTYVPDVIPLHNNYFFSQ